MRCFVSLFLVANAAAVDRLELKESSPKWPSYYVSSGALMQNLRRVGKYSGPILSRLWAKVYDTLKRCRRPLVVSNALARLCIYRVSFRWYRPRPLKLPLSCEIVEKRWFLDPRFVGGVTPQISDIHFQIALTSDTWPVWLSSVQWGRRVADEKAKKNRGKT